MEAVNLSALNCTHNAVVKTGMLLIKNGKMSHIAGLVASTLGIRAVSVFNEDGEIIAKHKVRGEEKALCAMTGMVLTEGGLDGKDIIITHCKNEAGVEKLVAAPVKAVDLRAGAAMLIAGLVAEGETVVEEIERIDRGYEDVVEKLTNLGADIKRVYYPDGIEILKQA